MPKKRTTQRLKYPPLPIKPADIPSEVYCIGIDLAKWHTGLALIKANLTTNERELVDWTLLNAETDCIKKYHKDYQYTYIAYWLDNAIEDWTRDVVQASHEQLFWGLETVFLGRNAHSMIDTAYIRGVVASGLHNWYADGHAMDIPPTTMKMMVTYGYEGNGHSPKEYIAAILKDEYHISDETFTAMTTLQKPRSVEIVHDVTDALGLADVVADTLRHKKGLDKD